jgi:hypothetical protein
VANGQERYCVTCAHFASNGGNVRSPGTRIRARIKRCFGGRFAPLLPHQRGHSALSD